MITNGTFEVEISGHIPKTLRSAISSRAHQIKAVDNEGRENGYWIYMRKGWECADMGCHTIHEYTVADCLSYMKSIQPCNCNICSDPKEGDPV